MFDARNCQKSLFCPLAIKIRSPNFHSGPSKNIPSLPSKKRETTLNPFSRNIYKSQQQSKIFIFYYSLSTLIETRSPLTKVTYESYTQPAIARPLKNVSTIAAMPSRCIDNTYPPKGAHSLGLFI